MEYLKDHLYMLGKFTFILVMVMTAAALIGIFIDSFNNDNSMIDCCMKNGGSILGDKIGMSCIRQNDEYGTQKFEIDIRNKIFHDFINGEVIRCE